MEKEVKIYSIKVEGQEKFLRTTEQLKKDNLEIQKILNKMNFKAGTDSAQKMTKVLETMQSEMRKLNTNVANAADSMKDFEQKTDNVATSADNMSRLFNMTNIKMAIKSVTSEMLNLGSTLVAEGKSASESVQEIGDAVSGMASNFGVLGAAIGAGIKLLTPFIAGLFELSQEEKYAKANAEALTKAIDAMADTFANIDDRLISMNALFNRGNLSINERTQALKILNEEYGVYLKNSATDAEIQEKLLDISLQATFDQTATNARKEFLAFVTKQAYERARLEETLNTPLLEKESVKTAKERLAQMDLDLANEKKKLAELEQTQLRIKSKQDWIASQMAEAERTLPVSDQYNRKQAEVEKKVTEITTTQKDLITSDDIERRIELINQEIDALSQQGTTQNTLNEKFLEQEALLKMLEGAYAREGKMSEESMRKRAEASDEAIKKEKELVEEIQKREKAIKDLDDSLKKQQQLVETYDKKQTQLLLQGKNVARQAILMEADKPLVEKIVTESQTIGDIIRGLSSISGKLKNNNLVPDALSALKELQKTQQQYTEYMDDYNNMVETGKKEIDDAKKGVIELEKQLAEAKKATIKTSTSETDEKAIENNAKLNDLRKKIAEQRKNVDIELKNFNNEIEKIFLGNNSRLRELLIESGMLAGVNIADVTVEEIKNRYKLSENDLIEGAQPLLDKLNNAYGQTFKIENFDKVTKDGIIMDIIFPDISTLEPEVQSKFKTIFDKVSIELRTNYARFNDEMKVSGELLASNLLDFISKEGEVVRKKAQNILNDTGISKKETENSIKQLENAANIRKKYNESEVLEMQAHYRTLLNLNETERDAQLLLEVGYLSDRIEELKRSGLDETVAYREIMIKKAKINVDYNHKREEIFNQSNQLDRTYTKQLEDEALEREKILKKNVKNVTDIISSSIPLIANIFEFYTRRTQAMINELSDSINNVDKQLQDSVSRREAMENDLAGKQSGRRDAVLRGIELERQREEALNRKKMALQNELAKAERKLRQQQKAAAITQAIINGALAVTNIWATTPKADFGVATGILTGISAATTATQVALIASQKFAKGGYTKKKGGVMDETGQKAVGIVHEGEWVAPKWMVNDAKYGEAISQLEEARLMKNTANFDTINSNVDTKIMIDALNTNSAAMIALSNRPIVASAVEFANVNQNLNKKINKTTV